MRRRRVMFLVNGGRDSAMDIRAREFAKRLDGEWDVRVANRGASKVQSIGSFLRSLHAFEPDICYVLDLAYSGVLAARLHRLRTNCPVIVDTGDAIGDLVRLTGSRGRLGTWLTDRLETLAFQTSSTLVVRSHSHQDLLARKGIASEVIPDGVDVQQFRPVVDPELRRELGIEGWTTIGMLGSVVWNERWKMCYGWDLVETVHLLRDFPVKGIVIGDGSGLEHLRAKAAALGLGDRMVFLGRRPYVELPRLLSALDICLSTQTDDAAGRVRTTGKLPLYLAAGRFVLASKVGEAARVLPGEMLVPYEGTKDLAYPRRLADRIGQVASYGKAVAPDWRAAAIAREHFDYDRLSGRLSRVLASHLVH